MLSPEGFLAGLAVAVLLPFFLRIYRTGMRDFVNIDDEFFGYRKGSFVGAETTILFSDKRVDRFAPSEFLEFGERILNIETRAGFQFNAHHENAFRFPGGCVYE